MAARIQCALKKHSCGYNCAQAVACTYCDLFGMEEDAVFKMMEGFGLGMGGMEHACGALSGAVALAGMKNSRGTDGTAAKAETYRLVKEIIAAFKQKNHSTICGELKGTATGRMLRSCPGCVQDAAEIVEKILLCDVKGQGEQA